MLFFGARQKYLYLVYLNVGIDMMDGRTLKS